MKIVFYYINCNGTCERYKPPDCLHDIHIVIKLTIMN